VKREKKDIKYLNVCLSKDLHEQFEAFCKKYGMSKVGATEQALKLFMSKVTIKGGL
jgi:hypothetical protein